MTIDEAIKEIKRWTGILMFHGNMNYVKDYLTM